jgi:adenylate cyclase
VAVVGFDVVFAEKDTSSGLNVLQELGRNQLKGVPQYQSALAQIQPGLEYDSLFAAKIKNRNVVLGYFFTQSGAGGAKSVAGVLPDAQFPPGTFKGRPITFVQFDSYGGNLPELQRNAAASGHFIQAPDTDGVVRRVPMIVEYEGAYYESLSLAVVRTALGMPKLVPGYATGKDKNYGGLEWLTLESPQGDLRIPVDAEVGALVPYRGRGGTFKYISVADALHERVPQAELQNKIVLVGTSASGLLDLRSTPVDTAYPGVEVHANLISGILNQNIKQNPPYVMGANVVLLIVIGVALAILLPMLSAIYGTLLSAGMLLLEIFVNGVVWQYGNLALPLAGGLIMVLMLFALNMTYGYFTESRTKKQLAGLFGQYVPSELVDEMSKNPEQVSMEGKSCEMTIMFSDVRGFTSISEKMKDAGELSRLMNAFLTPLSRVIYGHRGTIDKYMGDCIMAFWGAPLPDSRHAYHAVESGLEMQRALKALQPQFKEQGWPEIHIGVGINTGDVSVGNMGSEVRMAYTVMGDAVNLASRLEGITKEYGAGVLVGEKTKEQTPEFIYRELDLVRVKGKEKPVAIYEPLGLAGEVEQSILDEIKLFQQALRMYRKQEWDRAELQLFNLLKIAPQSKLYEVYAERVAHYRNNPPGESWDGVFVFKTK